MHDREAIREKIVSAIEGVEPELAQVQITEATSLADLKLDSLRLIELGVLLEDSFGAEMRFDDWIEQERARSDDAFSMESLISFIAGSARP